MKVLLLGAPDWGRDCWHDDLAAEATALGWSVDFIGVKDRPVDDVVRLAKDADMLIWARTHKHNPAGDAATMLRRVEDAGTATVGIHLDLYWGVPTREPRIGEDPWWTCQHVLTADGGPRQWARRGVNHRWCPPATGAARVGRAAPSGVARYVFTGRTMAVHGEHRLGLLRWARDRWGAEFRHYGEPPETAVYGRRLAGVVSYAHCVLGDSAPAAYYWSDRVVRTLARGGVLAHPRVVGMDQHSLTDEAVVLFGRYNFPELGPRLDSMTDAERAQLRAAGMDVVLSRHLWRHRLAELVGEWLP